VRRKRPSPSARGTNVLSVSSGRFQYPWATLGPATQISPTRPGGHGSPVSGSAIRISCSSQALPQPTSARPGPAVSPAGTAKPFSSAGAATVATTGSRPAAPPETKSVASARP
jgi:hypothetical protein